MSTQKGIIFQRNWISKMKNMPTLSSSRWILTMKQFSFLFGEMWRENKYTIFGTLRRKKKRKMNTRYWKRKWKLLAELSTRNTSMREKRQTRRTLNDKYGNIYSYMHSHHSYIHKAVNIFFNYNPLFIQYGYALFVSVF